MVKPIPDVDPVEVLVKYFTGWLVVEHSMGLAAGGMMKKRADEYFKLRMAMGIGGYATDFEARLAIRRALGLPS